MERINKTLFWDCEPPDPERHGDFIIGRILEYGNEHDLRALREIYPDSRLIEVVKHRRGLSKRTRGFWLIYFGIAEGEVTCMTR
jgi:hypothetical protein